MSRIDKFVALIFIAVLVGISWIIATKIIVPSTFESHNKTQQELKGNYDHDQIDLVTQEEVRDDGCPGPIVYIVKDKGTNKEYMIFTTSQEEYMDIIPR